MFVRVNAIFNTWGVILHEGRVGGLDFLANKNGELAGGSK